MCRVRWDGRDWMGCQDVWKREGHMMDRWLNKLANEIWKSGRGLV